MAKVIAFSGGCHSGKTTTINKVADILTARGYKVVKLSELMREVTDLSIDELRKQPSKYLDVQDFIIRKKIKQEREAFNDAPNVIYLVDRAISDSIFYLENYVDKSSLTDFDMQRLCNLDIIARYHALKAFTCGYSMLISFEPLDIHKPVSDRFRPGQLEHLSYYESQGIESLNKAFLWHKSDTYSDLYDFYLEANMRHDSIEDIVEVIINNLKL